MPLRPAVALTATLAARRPARVAALAAAFREAPGSGIVVLESPLTLVRLSDGELRRGTRDRLALDARQLRPNQGTMQPYFFRCRLRRSVAVIAVRRRVLRVLRLFVTRWGFRFFGVGVGHQHRVWLRILLHRLEYLVVCRFDRRLFLA